MRANTDRRLALVFGELVDHYEAGHPRLPAGFPVEVMARLGRQAGARQLEVGAGTGQLTGALLAGAGQVVALEPSAAMADRLRTAYAGEVASGRLVVRPERVEEADARELGRFDHVWSSDAWHWVDPSAGYRAVRELLAPDGLLVTTWSFPVVAEAELSEALNALYAELSPDLVRAEPYRPGLEARFEAGREELDRSGCLRLVEYWTEETRLTVPVDRYVHLQLSYAHVAEMDHERRRQLAGGIAAVVSGREPAGRVPLTVWRYTAASRPVPNA